MPILDGYAATRQIRATPTLAHLPVIALTAGAFKTQHNAALDAGMNDFVAKPFEVDNLIAVLQRYKSDGVQVSVSENGPESHPLVDATPKPEGINPPARLIDLERGLQVWRKSAAYDKALGVFSNNHADDGQRLQAALDDQDWELARSIAHKLRGAAGALALLRVAEQAATIEQILRDEGDARPCAPQLQETMAQTLVAIQEHLGVGSGSPAQAATTQLIAPDKLQKHIERLLDALDRDDLNLVETLLPGLAGHVTAEQMQRLQATIDAFDFRGTELLVNELALDAAKKE